MLSKALVVINFVICIAFTAGFSVSMSKTIYDVPNSGWTSPAWNWGYAAGTGHDCAAICRRNYKTRESRSSLVNDLYGAPDLERSDRQPQNFEEVKLVLALAWQRGRWDGSDGGQGGYGQVLAKMADADNYETGNEDECSIKLVGDMNSRFHLLDPKPEQMKAMHGIMQDVLGRDTDAARRRCSALVLDAMGFVENGL